MNEQQAQQNGFWAIVEIFGHQRIAGFLSEQTVGGQSFVRVDVPELAVVPPGRYGGGDGPVAAHSKLYGGGAIYAITPVDETVAREAARQIRNKPLEAYGLDAVIRNMPEEHRSRLLAPPGDTRDDDDGQPY